MCRIDLCDSGQEPVAVSEKRDINLRLLITIDAADHVC